MTPYSDRVSQCMMHCDSFQQELEVFELRPATEEGIDNLEAFYGAVSSLSWFEGWLQKQLKLLDEDPGQALLDGIRGNRAFLMDPEGLRIKPEQVSTFIGRHLTSAADISQDVLGQYRKWLNLTLHLVLCARAEHLFGDWFLDSGAERDALLKKLETARASIDTAQDYAVSHLEAARRNKEVKTEVLGFIQKFDSSYRSIRKGLGFSTSEACSQLLRVVRDHIQPRIQELQQALDKELKSATIIELQNLHAQKEQADRYWHILIEKDLARIKQIYYTGFPAHVAQQIKAQNKRFLLDLKRFNEQYLSGAVKERKKLARKLSGNLFHGGRAKTAEELSKARYKQTILGSQLKHQQRSGSSSWLDRFERYRTEKSVEALGKQTAELGGKLERLDAAALRLEKLDRELDAVMGVVMEQTAFQRSLLQQRELLKKELEQMQRLDEEASKTTRAMQVYAGFSFITFDALVALGNLIAETGGGAIGKALVVGGQFAPAIGAIQQGAAITGVLISTPSELGVLQKCPDYGTGSLSVSLKLGVSVGFAQLVDAGLALKYSSNINIGDDRKFRAVSTMALVGEASGGQKGIVEGQLELSGVNDTTVFVFNDVYQWAAWLAQKWANVVAWVTATTVYQTMGNKLDRPDANTLRLLGRMAQATLAKDGHLSRMMEKITTLVSEPMIRGDALQIAGGASGSVSVGGGILSGGGSVSRSKQTHFYRNELNEARTEFLEKQTSARQWGWTINVGIFGFSAALTYTDISAHPNPDNEGKYLNFSFEKAGGATDILAPPAPDVDEPAWLQDLMSAGDRVGGVTGVLDPKKLGSELETVSKQQSFSQGINVTSLEINLILSELSNPNIFYCKNKLCLKTRRRAWYHKLALTRPSCPECKKALTAASAKHPVSSWRLQYLRGKFGMGLSIQETFTAPGVLFGADVNVKVGASLAYGRTYGEFLGASTLSYLFTVYNGLHAIPDRDTVAESSRTGSELWKRYAAGNSQSLWKICRNLARNDSWAQLEVRNLEEDLQHEGDNLILECQEYFRNPDESFNNAHFSQSDLYASLERFLEANRKGWQAAAKARWRPYEHHKLKWTLNPVTLIQQIQASRQQIAKFGKLERLSNEAWKYLDEHKQLPEYVPFEGIDEDLAPAVLPKIDDWAPRVALSASQALARCTPEDIDRQIDAYFNAAEKINPVTLPWKARSGRSSSVASFFGKSSPRVRSTLDIFGLKKSPSQAVLEVEPPPEDREPASTTSLPTRRFGERYRARYHITDAVRNLTGETERSAYRLTVRDKSLCVGGSLLHTRDARFLARLAQEDPEYGPIKPCRTHRYIFVMSAENQIYAAEWAEEHRKGGWGQTTRWTGFHHGCFLDGGPVSAAGEIQVNKGQLELLSNANGLFALRSEALYPVLLELKGQGIAFDDSFVEVLASAHGTATCYKASEYFAAGGELAELTSVATPIVGGGARLAFF